MRKLGHEAVVIHANNRLMQRVWAEEHGIDAKPEHKWRFRLRRGLVPWLSRISDKSWYYDILFAQVSHYRPDVVLVLDMASINSRFLREIKRNVKLIIGQHAATQLPDSNDYGSYDLIISSFPPTIEFFQKKGVPTEFIRLGFEPEVLASLHAADKLHDLTFIGSLFNVHTSRMALLETLILHFPKMRIWGPSIDHLPADSSLRKCYKGQAWGRDMFQILRNSKITLNQHGDIPAYANNCRLYEATGMGALLVTDWKEDLAEIFEPGKEVVAYQNADECVEQVSYFLENEAEREAISTAGEQRTLLEHTYLARIKEVVDVVQELYV